MGIPIPGYSDYLIETDGRIFSKKTKKWMKAQIGANGYYGLELANEKGRKRLNVHRLVALTYIPNPLNLLYVNHKDENKLNNNVSNLEWCTAKYNMNYGTLQARRIANTDYTKEIYKIVAVENGKKVSIPVLMYNKAGDFIGSFESAKEAGRVTSINAGHISECCKKKRKSAGGYVWTYERGNDLSAYQL